MTLKPREAKLRAEALTELYRVANRIHGPTFTQDATKAVLYDHPGIALQRIKAAKAHLAKAEAALRKWAGR